MEIPIGRNIRRLRKGKGMTQTELAHQLNVSFQAVSKWERGYSYPDTALLLPIAITLDVSLDTLFCDVDEKENEKHRHSNI